jgi:nucleoside permease NupC
MAKEVNLPAEYRPLSMWEYLGYSILYSIPVLGLVCIIIFSLDNKNINRRNYSRSFLLTLLIGIVLIGILVATGAIAAIANHIAQ